MAVLDEPLDQVLEWARAGRFTDSPREHVPDDVLEHLSRPDQGHVRVFVGDVDRPEHAGPQLLELVRELAQAVDQTLQPRVHCLCAPVSTDQDATERIVRRPRETVQRALSLGPLKQRPVMARNSRPV